MKSRLLVQSLLAGLFFIFLKPNSSQAQYTIFNEFGNLAQCDTMSRGIFLVWWDNNWDYSADADILLDSMLSYQAHCLNDLNMVDPPNPIDGYFYNVYLHHGQDIFPGWWGNGQGTDANGYPYLTLPIGAHDDWVNVAHETFHVFQYNANSPGFSYSGDSQWYIEASANWFAAIRYPDFNGAFLEGESLVRLPHVPLWLSFDNFPASYPQNWQRYVHQYAMAMLLFYMTEGASLPHFLITQGFFSGTNELPQEYFYNQLSGPVFRNHFINWAAHMHNDFDFLYPVQVDRFELEWNDYADPLDDNEFSQIYQDEGSGGWYRPHDTLITTGWSFNTYKLLNSTEDNYRFELKGEAFGTAGDPAYFQGKILVRNNLSGSSFHDLNMSNTLEGSLNLALTANDTAVYFIIASMPEVFTNVHQLFRYDMQIEKGATSIDSDLTQPEPRLIGRYNVMGQAVGEGYEGVVIERFDDGSSRKVVVLND